MSRINYTSGTAPSRLELRWNRHFCLFRTDRNVGATWQYSHSAKSIGSTGLTTSSTRLGEFCSTR